MKSKVKVGDKIRVLDNHYEKTLRGKVGVVVGVTSWDKSPLVEFSDWNKGHDGYGEAVPRDGNTNRWYMGQDETYEKVNPIDLKDLDVGDRVRLIKDTYGRAKVGYTGTVVLAQEHVVRVGFDPEEFPDAGYGSDNGWNFWINGLDADYKDSLELIEAKPAEAKQEDKPVETTFKVGDRVVSLIDEHKLSKGNIGTVVKRGEFGVIVSFDNWTGGWGVESDQWYISDKAVKLYVEKAKPVETTFKVGDKVIAVKDVDLEATTGLVGEVIRIEDWGIRQPYLVRFDGFTEGHGEDDNEWYMASSDIKPYEEPEVETPLPEVDFLDAIGVLIWELTKLIVKEANPPVVVTPKPGRSLKVSPGAKTVLKHLIARGSISPVEAFSSYGTLRLAARIHELRQDGANIKTEMRKDAAGHTYARYTLA